MKLAAALLAASLLPLSSPRAADWPQWRGPDRNGISAEHLSAPWPAEGPKALWRASVGAGFSSISVSQGRAYTMGNANDKETVWCFDALTGQPIWKHAYDSKLGAVYHAGGPVATPTIQDGRVLTISKWGDVFCLDAAKGAVVWEHDLRRD